MGCLPAEQRGNSSGQGDGSEEASDPMAGTGSRNETALGASDQAIKAKSYGATGHIFYTILERVTDDRQGAKRSGGNHFARAAAVISEKMKLGRDSQNVLPSSNVGAVLRMSLSSRGFFWPDPCMEYVPLHWLKNSYVVG